MAAEKNSSGFRRMMGIAAKAGKIRSGEFQTERSVKSGKACLCILSSDASERTGKHFKDMCAFRQIPLVIAEEDKESLGRMIGRGPRSSAAIEDEGLAKVIAGLKDGGSASGE